MGACSLVGFSALALERDAGLGPAVSIAATLAETDLLVLARGPGWVSTGRNLSRAAKMLLVAGLPRWRLCRYVILIAGPCLSSDMGNRSKKFLFGVALARH